MGRVMTTAIFIPTLRINRIEKIVANIKQNTTKPYRIYFIVEPDVYQNLNHLDEVILNKRSPTYSGAINSAYEQTSEPYFYTGADDLEFQRGWLDKTLSKMNEKILVVGTNDLMNKHVLAGEKATHYLVKREYIEKYGGTIDNSFPVLYEYKHNYCDWEFIETAQKRGVFSPCLEAIVKHNHWTRGRSDFDEVYRKSESSKNDDKITYNSRRHLWK